MYVSAMDRMNLLRDVTVVLSECNANVLASSTNSRRDNSVEMRFLFQLDDIARIDTILAKLRMVNGVYDAYRMVAGSQSKKKSKKNQGK